MDIFVGQSRFDTITTHTHYKTCQPNFGAPRSAPAHLTSRIKQFHFPTWLVRADAPIQPPSPTQRISGRKRSAAEETTTERRETRSSKVAKTEGGKHTGKATKGAARLKARLVTSRTIPLQLIAVRLDHSSHRLPWPSLRSSLAPCLFM